MFEGIQLHLWPDLMHAIHYAKHATHHKKNQSEQVNRLASIY